MQITKESFPHNCILDKPRLQMQENLLKFFWRRRKKTFCLRKKVEELFWFCVFFVVGKNCLPWSCKFFYFILKRWTVALGKTVFFCQLSCNTENWNARFKVGRFRAQPFLRLFQPSQHPKSMMKVLSPLRLESRLVFDAVFFLVFKFKISKKNVMTDAFTYKIAKKSKNFSWMSCWNGTLLSHWRWAKYIFKRENKNNFDSSNKLFFFFNILEWGEKNTQFLGLG